MPYASAPAYDAQSMYVSMPGGAMPVVETRTRGTGYLSGIAFVAGLSVTFATLAHYAQKKTAPRKVAALATAGEEFWDDLEHSTCNAVASPWSPLTTYEHFLEETDVQKKIAMLAAAGEFVPDMQRRTIMNIILLSGVAVPVGWMGGAFVYFFIPPKSGGGGAGLVAKDALGDDVTKDGWTAKHPAGDP